MLRTTARRPALAVMIAFGLGALAIVGCTSTKKRPGTPAQSVGAPTDDGEAPRKRRKRQRPASEMHPEHTHGHLHPHDDGDHHHHPHPHPHLASDDGHHHPY